jgi:hypothetical protein
MRIVEPLVTVPAQAIGKPNELASKIAVSPPHLSHDDGIADSLSLKREWIKANAGLGDGKRALSEGTTRRLGQGLAQAETDE